MNKRRNIIIVVFLMIILLMAVGYSAFTTQLYINGSAEIVETWDVEITNIEIQNVSDNCNGGTPQFTSTTATFSAELEKPGDSITYEITIQNLGTLNATLKSATFTCDEESGSEAIVYTNTTPSQTLAPGEETKVTVTVEYDKNTTEMPSVTTKTITGIIEYVQ